LIQTFYGQLRKYKWMSWEWAGATRPGGGMRDRQHPPTKKASKHVAELWSFISRLLLPDLNWFSHYSKTYFMIIVHPRVRFRWLAWGSSMR
jgi:hypothetical protein